LNTPRIAANFGISIKRNYTQTTSYDDDLNGKLFYTDPRTGHEIYLYNYLPGVRTTCTVTWELVAANGGGDSFWDNLNIDFTGGAKITLGVQAGLTVGALGGKYGVHADLISASLLGIENGKAIYPGGRKNGLTQFNQSISGGYYVYGGVNHTWDSSVLQDNNWSVNSQVSYDISSPQGYGISLTGNSLQIGFSIKAAVIIGFEGNFGITINW
jgi:hypothetical protein